MIMGNITRRRALINNNEKAPPDYLTLLLTIRDENQEGLTDETILDEIKTMVLAGHETSGLWLTWTFHVLSKRKDLRDNIFDEVRRVVADKDVVSYEDARSLDYTLRVLNESLRLYPPVPALMREAVEDDEINGIAIPKVMGVDDAGPDAAAGHGAGSQLLDAQSVGEPMGQPGDVRP